MELNKVYLGDCLEVMKDIPNKSIDMVLTSPPYDNLRDYKGYTFNFEGIAKEIYRVLKDGGVCVWVVGDATIKGSETGTSFKQALYFKEIGFNLHDTMIWNKGSFTNPSSNRFHQVFEYMFIFSKGKPKIYHEILDRKNKYLGVRGASGRDKNGVRKCGTSEVKREYGNRFNIWNISVGGGMSYKGKCNHPAVFPEKLAEDHILSWSNEGDTILDPMAGSGTTLKMAKKNNRNYIGIEISPEYIDIINKRLN
jgi:site-specific DNA-methyltransferase (adenine-specific)